MSLFSLGITIVIVAGILLLLSQHTEKKPKKIVLVPEPNQKSSKYVQYSDDEAWPYKPMTFMTPAEVRFFRLLKQAIPEYSVFAQVQLSQLVQCSIPEQEKFWFNRICRMSVDYVLIDQDDQTILLILELDDWTHHRADRIQADAKKDRVIASAGLPMLRIAPDDRYTALSLRKVILHLLSK